MHALREYYRSFSTQQPIPYTCLPFGELPRPQALPHEWWRHRFRYSLSEGTDLCRELRRMTCWKILYTALLASNLHLSHPRVFFTISSSCSEVVITAQSRPPSLMLTWEECRKTVHVLAYACIFFGGTNTDTVRLSDSFVILHSILEHQTTASPPHVLWHTSSFDTILAMVVHWFKRHCQRFI
jgi:hypothetical protein